MANEIIKYVAPDFIYIKGNQIKKEIIDPILEYIRENCVEFNIERCGLTEGNILRQMFAATNIIQMIDKSLHLNNWKQ